MSSVFFSTKFTHTDSPTLCPNVSSLNLHCTLIGRHTTARHRLRRCTPHPLPMPCIRQRHILPFYLLRADWLLRTSRHLLCFLLLCTPEVCGLRTGPHADRDPQRFLRTRTIRGPDAWIRLRTRIVRGSKLHITKIQSTTSRRSTV